MTLKRIYMAGAGICLAVSLWAQPKFTVNHEVANMGEVIFQLPRQVSFSVTNKGNQPLVIKQVTPSCGCTTVEWPRAAIAPGESGEITALYDAAMLGVFQKELEVYTNAAEEPVYLHLQGRVVSHATDYSGTFPVDLGTVRINTNVIEFDEVNKGDRPMAEIQVVNMGRKSYKPELMHLPPYLTAQYFPETLAGGRIGKIVLTLDSKRLMQMGLTQTSLYLARFMGDKVNDENEISVSAVLLPDFSKLTARQLDQAPVMALSADSLDLGALNGKKKVSGVVTIKNEGATPLSIRSVQVFNNALNVNLGNRTIAPGKTTKLKIAVVGKYLQKSKSRPRVLLITDDPKHPKAIITVQVKP